MECGSSATAWVDSDDASGNRPTSNKADLGAIVFVEQNLEYLVVEFRKIARYLFCGAIADDDQRK